MLKVINIINILVLTLILCFAVLLWEVRGIKQKNLEMIGVAERFRDYTNRNLNMVSEALAEKGVAQAKHKEVMIVLQGREDWIKVLNELNSVLPENLWLTKIAASSGVPPYGLPANKIKGLDFGAIFSGKSSILKATTASSTNVEWIRIEGHTLILNDTKSMIQELRDNFIESRFFTDNKDEIRVPSITFGRASKNNLTEFEMLIKLKKSIKR